jgi:predicted nuclease of predicted toxin-antitoxin system
VIFWIDAQLPPQLVNGTPPQLLWVTCGNVSNRRLHEVFDKAFPQALLLLREGRPVIEIADA